MKCQQTLAHDVVIVAAKRTPIGSFLGALSSLSAPHIAAVSHRACLQTLDFPLTEQDAVIQGCVLSAGIGQAPARQAAHFAGVPDAVGATTVNKMCGSGMQALIFAHDALKAKTHRLILAGGMESMSQAPYLLKKARSGYRLGHGPLLDHLLLDGLEDAYHPGMLMGCFAEETAKHLHITRAQQDAYAHDSMQRALDAQASHAFEAELAPVESLLAQDEHPDPQKLAKISRLKPSFSPEGTITPASSSAISDGAASLLITTRAFASKAHLPILATIKGHATFATAPQDFPLAPINAIQRLLSALDWRPQDVDRFEINEAFAIVPLAAMAALKLPHDRVNIHGGACALGHPIGASGARIVVTLLSSLIRDNLTRGIATLCIGGGEATALAIDRS